MGQQDTKDSTNQDEANQEKKTDKKSIKHRRGWGKIEPKKGACGVKYYPSYATPKQYCSKFPNQEERQVLKGGTWSRTEASAWLDEEKRLIKDDEWTPVKEREARRERNSVLFRDYAAEYINKSESKEQTKTKQREWLKNHLLNTFGDMQVKSILPIDVERWYSSEPPLEIRNKAYKFLKQIMKYACEHDIDGVGGTLIDRNPCRLKTKTVKKQHETVSIDDEQFNEYVSYMPEKVKLAAMLGYHVGLRIGEVLALQRRDIDLKNSIIHVRHSLNNSTRNGVAVVEMGDTKTSSSNADLTIREELKPWIEKQLEEYTGKEPDSFLFAAKNGSFIRPNNFRDDYHNKARAQVKGLENLWFHDLRHACGSHMLSKGVPLQLVSKQLRHADTQITAEKYIDVVSTADLRKADKLANESISKVPKITEPTETASSKSVDSMESLESTKPNSSDNEAASGLYAFLVSMEMSARIQALKGMSKEQRKQAIDSLPDGMKEETKDAFINSI
ncbi:tyrosine-type recombinase/integrase [Gardnerella vaginalis]|uniref:tyrosine-type recombinase/integrase n=1 Tax=Gardnerella vaginalis TaxID=2702 RepID=UPI0039F0BE09